VPIFYSKFLLLKKLKAVLSPEIEQKIAEICENHGAHLVGAALRGGTLRRRLEIYIDSETGVTHNHCHDVSRAIDDAFENTDFIDSVEHIDVSSPGADAPLKFSWQYIKHEGRTLEGILKDGTAFKGKILGSDENAVTIEPDVDKKTLKRHQKPEPLALSFSDIETAKIALKW
jgi:ribosome maturation factor RimP